MSTKNWIFFWFFNINLNYFFILNFKGTQQHCIKQSNLLSHINEVETDDENMTKIRKTGSVKNLFDYINESDLSESSDDEDDGLFLKDNLEPQVIFF